MKINELSREGALGGCKVDPSVLEGVHLYVPMFWKDEEHVSWIL